MTESGLSVRTRSVSDQLRSAGCVFADEEARLLVAEATTSDELTAMVERRVAGEPLEEILGWSQFCGLRIGVDPGVFVPRLSTEFLVHRACELAPVPGSRSGPTVVVDLCCGTGAIGLALADRLGDVELHAVDIDPAAVRCAAHNLTAVTGTVYEGDLDEPLPDRLRGRVDLLVANAPYVPTDSIDLLPREARLHESPVALDGGRDGLDVVRRMAAVAPRWLAPGGHLLVEANDRQAGLAAAIFESAGLVPEVAHLDEPESTVVIGTRPIPPIEG